MRIQHNIAALNSYRNLTGNNNTVSKNLEKLSSGYRINRAGDDAAGLAISEKMRAQITGLETASKNANDGISLIQTAEGALTEVHSMLNRMVELAEQSANGTYQDAVDRDNIQKEVKSLSAEIDRISAGTNYNGIKLLDGSMGTGTTGATGTIAANTGAGVKAFSFELSGVDEGVKVVFAAADGTGTAAAAKGVWGTDNTLTITVNSAADGTGSVTQDMINKAIKDASGAPASAKDIKVKLNDDITFSGASTATASLGDATAAKAKQASVVKDGVTVTANKAGLDTRTIQMVNGTTQGVTVTAAGNVQIGLSTNAEYSASDINNLLSKAGVDMTVSFEGKKTSAALADTTTGFGTAQALSGGAGLGSGGGLVLQIGESSESYNQLTVKVGSMSTASLGLDKVDTSNQVGAQAAVDIIKNAINTVSSTRGDLGALQNRLEHTINNLSVTSENMTAAESRIRDVDMAKEMMGYTKNNILVQASQAMLAQANQVPQGVLQLLK